MVMLTAFIDSLFILVRAVLLVLSLVCFFFFFSWIVFSVYPFFCFWLSSFLSNFFNFQSALILLSSYLSQPLSVYNGYFLYSSLNASLTYEKLPW